MVFTRRGIRFLVRSPSIIRFFGAYELLVAAWRSFALFLYLPLLRNPLDLLGNLPGVCASLDSHPSRAPGSAEKGNRPRISSLAVAALKDWQYQRPCSTQV